MNVSLYEAAAAMNDTSRWEDAVTANMAASMVPGYRKLTLATAAVQEGLMPASSASNPPQFFSVPQSNLTTSFQNGETKFTGDNKDVAVDGAGFFQVKMANGTTAVTRSGEFRVNPSGVLVTKEGYTVLSDTKEPIQLDLSNHDPISINPGGDVLQGTAAQGKIGLTDFENPRLLTATDGVYFLTDNPALQSKPATGTLRDGFLEGSNTNSLNDMISLLTAMRVFEANQKVVQTQDDRLGKTISELGTPS